MQEATIFRIKQTDKGSHSLFLFEGQLLRDSVDVTRECCERAIAAGRRVHLFLQHVPSVDASGRELLKRLGRRGVVVHGSGIYTSYLAQAAKPWHKIETQ